MISLSHSNPYVGEIIKLTCNSSTNTVPKTHNLSVVNTWMIENVENPTDPRYTFSASRNTLTILGVTKTDGAKAINCVVREDVTNGYTSDNSDSLFIDVQCKYFPVKSA